MASCEPPFWKDPLALGTHFNLSYDPNCESQIWNFLVRLLILAILVGGLGSAVCGYMSFAICILFAMIFATVIIMTSRPPSKEQTKEQMESFEDCSKPKALKEAFTGSLRRTVNSIVGVDSALPYNDAAPYSGPALPEYTPPAARNLFMNVLIDEYKYNPDRPPAAPVDDPVVKQAMDDYFRVQWVSDPTDIFGKSQSQRQFVTQPSTSVPNDRKSFQDWLYKIPGKTCKEGGREACLAGTDGGPIPWLNSDR
jgi:hypothetical protein